MATLSKSKIRFDGAEVTIKKITPHLAREWLAHHNDHNRVPSKTAQKKIAQALLSGDFDFNGDAIRIAEDGTVLDGQHRLRACVQTGVSFHSIVVTGLRSRTQTTMDLGRPRSVSDTLKIQGESYAAGLGAILAALRAWMVKGIPVTQNQQLAFTPQQALQILERFPHVRDFASIQTRQWTALGIPPTQVGLLGFISNEASLAVKYGHYIEGVRVGAGLPKGDVRLAVRNRLVKEMSSHRPMAPQARSLVFWDGFEDYIHGTSRERMQVPSNWLLRDAWPDLPGDKLRGSEAPTEEPES